MDNQDEASHNSNKENPSLRIKLKNFHCYKCSITLNSLDDFNFHIDSIHKMSKENESNVKYTSAGRRKSKNNITNNNNPTSSQNQRKKSKLSDSLLRASNANRSALKQLQDYMHCVKCFATFYKLSDLLKHFKGCQIRRSSLFTDYKRNETSDCRSNFNPQVDELNYIQIEMKQENDKFEDENEYSHVNFSPAVKQEVETPVDKEIEENIIEKYKEDEEEHDIEGWESEQDDYSEDANYEPDDDLNFEPDEELNFEPDSSSKLKSRSNKPKRKGQSKSTDKNSTTTTTTTNNAELPFACSKCDNRYKTKDNLRNHIAAKHGDTKFTCDLCPFSTPLRSNLYPHYKKQHPEIEKIYKCYKDEGKCKEAFATIKEFRGHIKKVHCGRRSFVCPVENCTRKFYSRFGVNDHLNVHQNRKPHICEFCGMSFATMDCLHHHRRVHRDPSFKCPDCDRMFKRKDDLKNHSALHSEERFPCTVPGCQSTCSTLKGVTAHIRAVHGGVTLLCQVCGSSFKSQGSYDRHQKAHRGEKRHRCSFFPCDKAFVEKSELSRHERTHMGVQGKVRPCRFCDKKFGCASSRNRHELTHTKLRPYKCAFCDLTFPDNRPLKKHVTNFHTGEFEFDLNIPTTYQVHPRHQAPGQQQEEDEPSGQSANQSQNQNQSE